MSRGMIIQAIVTVGFVIALFSILFGYFGLEWWIAAFLAFILGEFIILVPIYVLFFDHLKK